MRCRALLPGWLLLTWGAVGSADALAAGEGALRAAITAIEADIQQSGADVAIAFQTLDGESGWFVRADEPFHAASTMKVAVLIGLYDQVRRGRVKLDDTLPVKNSFTSLADGSPYTLDPNDDSERDLYLAVGSTRTLAQLSDLMITVSSNLATNLLIEKLGVDDIRASVHALDADGMQVRRGVEDTKAFEQGLNNTTTARGLFRLMQALAQDHAVDRDASRQMVGILERQTFNDAIPAGLPPGTRVAHKTGEITRVHHDAAIVFAPRPFVLVILTRGLADEKDSAALMAQITRALYRATQASPAPK